MTSEPGTTGPGTGSDTGTPEVAPRAGAGSSWPLVLPLALLIILGLAGLRGVVAAPRWNQSLRHDGLAIGLALEVVLGVLLVVTARRRSRASRAAALGQVPLNEVAAKLREVLIFALGGGMIAVAVAFVISLHLRFPRPNRKLPPLAVPTLGFTAAPRRSQVTDIHFPLAASLYGLLIAALVAGVLLSIWWARRFRPSFGAGRSGFVAQDPEDLLEAVESGRSALRTVDDARAAIVACYVAMEKRLAERGAARAVADTPDELLARASASGLVRGSAAERLTALFYEARFSSHPLGHEQRDVAEQALNELAGALAEPTQAWAGA